MLMGPKVESRLAGQVREAAPRSKGLAWRWLCRRKKRDSVPAGGEDGRSCFALLVSPCVVGFLEPALLGCCCAVGSPEGVGESHGTARH